MKSKFLAALALTLAVANCGSGESTNRLTVAGNVAVPTPSKVTGTYEPIELSAKVLEKFELEVEAPDNPCIRDLDFPSRVNATLANNTVTDLRLVNFLNYHSGNFNELSVPNPNTSLLNGSVFSQTYTGLNNSTAECSGQIKQFGNFVNIVLSCRVRETGQLEDVCSVGMAREVEEDAPVGSSNLSGLYRSVSGNTCYDPASGDTDGLRLIVNGGNVVYFGLDDDFTEQVQSFSGNRIRYTFDEDNSVACSINFTSNAASGSCSVNGRSCNLRYEKCSNDPNTPSPTCDTDN